LRVVQHLLPHIAAEVREARAKAGLSFAHVAVHVRKHDGKHGVSEATLSRFERARHWPENPDAIVQGYAHALGVEPRHLWTRAVTRWAKAAKAD
jgi:hypothetical protein